MVLLCTISPKEEHELFSECYSEICKIHYCAKSLKLVPVVLFFSSKKTVFLIKKKSFSPYFPKTTKTE